MLAKGKWDLTRRLKVKGQISEARVSSAHRHTKVQFIDGADSVRPLKDARRPSFIQKMERKAVQSVFIMDMECSNLTNWRGSRLGDAELCDVGDNARTESSTVR